MGSLADRQNTKKQLSVPGHYGKFHVFGEIHPGVSGYFTGFVPE